MRHNCYHTLISEKCQIVYLSCQRVIYTWKHTLWLSDKTIIEIFWFVRWVVMAFEFIQKKRHNDHLYSLLLSGFRKSTCPLIINNDFLYLLFTSGSKWSKPWSKFSWNGMAYIIGRLLYSHVHNLRSFTPSLYLDPGGGAGTPIYGLYMYVPQKRVWFLRFSILE